MAGENASGIIFGKIVDSADRPLVGVQVSISFVTCDVETNMGQLTIFPAGSNKLRGKTTASGIFCVAFEWKPWDAPKVMSRAYDARLSAIQWADDVGNQARPAIRFTARVALALDVKNWFLNGIGAPQWNNPGTAAVGTSAGLWATYRSAVASAEGVKAASLPNLDTLSIEHFGLIGDAGTVRMPIA